MYLCYKIYDKIIVVGGSMRTLDIVFGDSSSNMLKKINLEDEEIK